jgi:hypothetical protein
MGGNLERCIRKGRRVVGEGAVSERPRVCVCVCVCVYVCDHEDAVKKSQDDKKKARVEEPGGSCWQSSDRFDSSHTIGVTR